MGVYVVLQVVQSSQEHVPNREQWDAQMGPLPANLKLTNDPSELSNVSSRSLLRMHRYLLCTHP